MKIFKTRSDLQKIWDKKEKIAFIPTMGALHAGHVSMIKKAKKNKQKTLISIFINPKQFNSNKDYTNYPKNIMKDRKILKNIKIDYLFLPSVKQIYSFKTKNKIFLDVFEKRLCGRYRPGHFKGVVNVVNRFLEIIKPDTIYLGEKDFQQLYLIKKHINKSKIKTKIVPCKTIRNKCGLALSSRIFRLTTKEITIACKIVKIIKDRKKQIIKNRLKNFNFKDEKNKINSFKFSKVEYIEAINLNNLKKINNYVKNFKIFISFYINKVRLIDNI